MIATLPAGIPVLATTATANARVTADVAEQLGTDVLVLRGSLDRESLHLAVLQLERPEHRLAWLGEHLGELDGCGIIYTLTVAATQEVAEHLRSHGHAVAAYSGQTEATERLALEQDLLSGRLKALVATSALGMGFDARLGFVVNLGAPSSPVAYYQQVGRAGRGTGPAKVILLPAHEDRDIWRYFASLAFPPEQHVRSTLRALAENGAPMSTAALETYVDLSRNRLETMLKVLDVDGAVDRVRGRLDRHRRRTGSTTRSATTGSPPRAATSRPRCWPTPRPTAAGCASCASSSTTRAPRTADAATTAAGSPCPARSRQAARRRGRRAAAPTRA